MVLTMKHGSAMDILMQLQDSYARYLLSEKLFTRIQQVWKMSGQGEGQEKFRELRIC